MNLKITLVPVGELHPLIPALVPYLGKSEFWSHGRAVIDDILGFLFSGRMQLWVAYNPETHAIFGYVITEIKDYSRCKMFVVQYCACEPDHMKFVEEEMFTTLEAAAKSVGCKGIEFFGRPGWGPHAKKHGYMTKTVVYEKHFDEVQS
jgi:hypothetical protein